ncbi:MAG: dicarboxylate transporter, DctM subunit [Proteobacteria bacterium]|nr:dicarboxylate transporter, DctM subunit [Pseudomonadota bacterium]
MTAHTHAEPLDESLTAHDAEVVSSHPAKPVFFLSAANQGLTKATATIGAIALAVNVLVVFASIFWRYALNEPVEWAEEVARALMVTIIFCGAATSMGKGRHIGVDLFLGWLPDHARAYVAHGSRWILLVVSFGLTLSSIDLVTASLAQTTSTGLPQVIYVLPVVLGALVMTSIALEHSLQAQVKQVVISLVGVVMLALIGFVVLKTIPEGLSGPGILMLSCFILGVVAGVPIAFTLGISAMTFFVTNPNLPFVFFAQQVSAGVDHFVLLSIPFFLLAGAAMEVNGMSSRLVELIVRCMGRFRGGLNMTIVVAIAFFSGISGSKLADIAAVGGVLMPAVRRARQSSKDAAGLFAASAVMAETIPPCVNMIVMGFVANISIGALFIAGLVPAACLLLLLIIASVVFGKRINVEHAYPVRMPMKQLLLGAGIGLAMVIMIGRGVMAGIATSTEISSFAVVYAIVVGRLAFRELTFKATVKLFVDTASMSGMLLFIVAAATSLSYALTMEMIPQKIAEALVSLGNNYGSGIFLILSIVMVAIFGAVLEGAPALIIFAPILVPIGVQLGFDPLHFATVLILAMGLGLFSPPIGLGLYTTCAICGVSMKDVIRPMFKYWVIITIGLFIVAFVPFLTVWLPKAMGYGV